MHKPVYSKHSPYEMCMIVSCIPVKNYYLFPAWFRSGLDCFNRYKKPLNEKEKEQCTYPI